VQSAGSPYYYSLIKLKIGNTISAVMSIIVYGGQKIKGGKPLIDGREADERMGRDISKFGCNRMTSFTPCKVIGIM